MSTVSAEAAASRSPWALSPADVDKEIGTVTYHGHDNRGMVALVIAAVLIMIALSGMTIVSL